MALYAVASGLTERAICFEPEMRNFSLLKKNLRRNGLHSKIAAYCVGLASSKSNATLVTSADNFGDHRVFTPNELEGSDKYNSGHRNRSSIELETLDDMYSSRFNNSEIGFICLDVQGFELEVIRGGDRVFSKSPALMMELDPYLLEKKGCTIEELHRYLAKYYAVFVDLTTMPPEKHDIERLTSFYRNLKEMPIQHKDVLFMR